jgi:hypothetical protein
VCAGQPVSIVGLTVGDPVGTAVGVCVGVPVSIVGLTVGVPVGTAVGVCVGELDGRPVGGNVASSDWRAATSAWRVVTSPFKADLQCTWISPLHASPSRETEQRERREKA